MSEAEDQMNASMDAARRTPVSVPSVPRPRIPNVAASVSPGGRKPAARQPQPVNDEHGTDVAFRFAFLGAGQGGGRIANAFWKLGYRRVAAFNTTDADFAGLDDSLPKLSLDVGGAGKDTGQARAAMRGREEDVRDLLTRAWGTTLDYALICTSLGGGTGSGSAPELVKLARQYMKDRGLPPRVGAIVSLPTLTEGFQVCRNAVQGFQALQDAGVSPLIVIDNAKIHQLYQPAMSQLHSTANETVASLLHLFNQLASVHSQYITFDRSELGQILDSGLVVMGASDIQKFDSPADVGSAIREQLSNNVLAQVDLKTGNKAACLFVGSQEVLDQLNLDYFEAGYAQLDRTLGGGNPDAQTVVHRGLYAGDGQGLQAYVMVGGLALPSVRLAELARKGGLGTNPRSGSAADHLGVDDGGPT
jgi:cell division GTPase FtsZ